MTKAHPGRNKARSAKAACPDFRVFAACGVSNTGSWSGWFPQPPRPGPRGSRWLAPCFAPPGFIFVNFGGKFPNSTWFAWIPGRVSGMALRWP